MSVKVTGVVDAVAAELQRMIFRGELAMGEPMTEARVAERFEVARPSAKAAIEKLVAEGLLERTAHRSARVRQLDEDSVRDIYRTRVRLEGQALRELAARGTVPLQARAADLEIARFRGGSSLDVVEPDMRFHTAIVDALDSERMSRAYRSLVSEVHLCMAQVQGQRLVSVDGIHSDHEAILDHLAMFDAAGALAVLERHLGGAEDRLVEVLNRTR